VEDHHGKINVTSTLGQGTIFSVMLPFQDVAESADGTTPARQHMLHSKPLKRDKGQGEQEETAAPNPASENKLKKGPSTTKLRSMSLSDFRWIIVLSGG
jgi:hypothetical protein